MKFGSIARAPLALLLLSCANQNVATPAVAPVTAGAAAMPSNTLAPSAMSVQPQTTAPTGALMMPPLEPGYQRYVATPIDVDGGSSNDWMQWVGGPTDQDYDVSSIKGAQSRIGHHALMLATTTANASGFTRLWEENDQLSARTMGGIGAEGAIPLPDGVVIRIKKGSYFAIQTHYLNAGDTPAKGETYIDIKLEPTDPANILASQFASTSLKMSLSPHAQTSVDLHCKTERDLKILRMANHMHHFGVSVFTEFTDPSGATSMLKKDDVWSDHWALAPNYEYHTVADPMIIPMGSDVHTRCTWNNTSDDTVTFPTEMCVFATLILGDADISCIEGKFAVSNTEQPTAAAPPAPAASAPSAAMPGASGVCTDDADKALLDAADFQDAVKTCATSCLGGDELCATQCLEKSTTLTQACATCYGARVTCSMSHCIADCAAGFMDPGCNACIESNCGAAYHACSGM